MCPSWASSPWILLYPQPLFSVASRAMRAAISALTGDRPVRLGQIHLRVTRQCRCLSSANFRELAAVDA